MGDADQELGPLPGGHSLKIYHTVFRNDEIDLTSGGGDDIPFKLRPDPGMNRTVHLIMVGGFQTDKCLASVGCRCSRKEIQLSSRSADLAGSGTLGRYLTVEIHGHASVDGYHIVNLRDGKWAIHIFQRIGGHARIVIQPFIELGGTHRTSEDPFSPVNTLSLVRELPCLVKRQKCVCTQLRMHSQIPDVCFRYDVSDRIGDPADTELERRSVHDIRDDMLCDLTILLRGDHRKQVRKGLMLPLYDIVHLGNVDTFIISSVDPWQMLVDLHDHDIRLPADGTRNPRIYGEIEIAVLIHGTYADHHHIYFDKEFIVRSVIMEYHGDIIAKKLQLKSTRSVTGNESSL